MPKAQSVHAEGLRGNEGGGDYEKRSNPIKSTPFVRPRPVVLEGAKRYLHELGTKTGGAVESLNKTDTPIASVSQNTMDQLTRLYKIAMEDTSDLNRRTARGGLDRSLRIAAGKGSPDDLMRRVVGEAVREDDLPTEIWRLAREAASDDASDDLIRRIATAAAINSAPRSLARRLVTQGQAMLPPTITDGGSRQRGQSILLPKASFEDS